ncbi:hypothetical protein BDW71DRAFT_178098, partial [Aspergillus fruticulosus]
MAESVSEVAWLPPRVTTRRAPLKARYVMVLVILSFVVVGCAGVPMSIIYFVGSFSPYAEKAHRPHMGLIIAGHDTTGSSFFFALGLF